MSEKTALRAAMRARRDAFHATGPAVITPPPAYLAGLRSGAIVAAYVPVGSEADPGELVAAARAADCRIALPHVTTRDRPLRFLAWDPASPLLSGPFGLRQPPADAAVLRPDIVLTPLLAFDAERQRLGQGAGYYDRALAALSGCWRVGIAWSVQQVAQVPVDPWDVPLDAVVTERAWLA